MKQFDSQKRHFVVMLKLIHPAHHTVVKEPAFIGYALWISIGCHASYPIWWWQAAFPMHMQSVICHLRVLMRRIKYEESYIQTDGRCNIHIRQPYVQQFFLYWFEIRDSSGIKWEEEHLVKPCCTSHIILGRQEEFRMAFDSEPPTCFGSLN